MEWEMKYATVAFGAGLCLAAAASATASGTLVQVANNGLDTATCGSRAAPCRSIGRGIERANAGDTVLVGPGKYGDLNEDGILGGPGEESGFNNTALHITKAVRVVSSAGAALTVIDGGGGLSLFSTVKIDANNVVFGEVEGGFTLTGGESGLTTDGYTGVRIVGNIASGARAMGFWVNAGGTTPGVIDVSYNIAHDNGQVGFLVGSLLESSRVTVRYNKSYSNGTGIISATYGRHEVAYNEVSNNSGTGISVDFTPSFVHHNVVTGNNMGITTGSWGVGREPSVGPLVSRNSLIGNTRFGVLITAGPVRMVLKENNFYGNGVSTDEYGANCGLANFTGGTLAAPNNYWGAATGPGSEPADVACGNDPVVTTPFARSPN
jgi:hypothetical protein